MNVTHIDTDSLPTLEDLGVTCKLEAIFKGQRMLMDEYHDIEKKNGLLLDANIPVNIHDRFGQARLKDFAWRTTEEIAEACEAMEEGKSDPNAAIHFYEEMGDALHFITELAILSGLTPQDIIPTAKGGSICRLDVVLSEKVSDRSFGSFVFQMAVRTGVYTVVTHLGKAMNCLKQKPWKQSHMMTDEKKYKELLSYTYLLFLGLCGEALMTPKDVYSIYFQKHSVNQFRIRSKY